MGLYIPNIEMPKSCIACLLNFGEKRPEYGLTICCPYSDGVISWRDKAFDNGRLASCGIVPVPPHGSAAIEKVISERISQIERWGEDPYNHPFEWMSILGEEFGELCEAVNETCFMNGKHPERGGDENIIREATQIAAVAIAIIEDFLPSDTAPTIIPAEEGE